MEPTTTIDEPAGTLTADEPTNDDILGMSDADLTARITALETAGPEAGAGGKADVAPAASTPTGVEPADKTSPAAGVVVPAVGTVAPPSGGVVLQTGPAKTAPDGAVKTDPAFEVPDPIKKLIPEQYKGDFKAFVDSHKELNAFLGRQANEIGALRQEIARREKAGGDRPVAGTVVAPGEPVKTEDPITDAQINAAFFEEMDAPKAYGLMQERQRRETATQTAAAAETRTTEETYTKSLQAARTTIAQHVPDFFGADGTIGEAGKQVLQYGIDHGYVANQDELDRINWDPVAGPKMIAAIFRDMTRSKELEGLKEEHQRRLETLEKDKAKTADTVAARINKAARSPQVMGAEAGGGTGKAGEIDMPTDLSGDELAKLTDAQVDQMMEKAKTAA